VTLAGLGALLDAQGAGEIVARHRSGQTFVTWRELAPSGSRYRVYRASRAITRSADLAAADFLGEVDDRSSRNSVRTLATGVEHTWVIEPGGSEMPADKGLFVHTAQAPSDQAFYAVTAVVAGQEDLTIGAGRNAARSALREVPAPPQPVLQNSSTGGELWAHWVGNRATPHQPALAPWPSRGFNFQFQPGSAAGARGLVLRLHAAGQTYAEAWPHRNEIPADIDALGLSDVVPGSSFSFWFGSQERLPGSATSNTRVWNYTQQRVLWTLDWIVARLGAAHDPERVSIVGGSMGAIGGMLLLNEAPERFSAALLRNGLYDLQAGDYRNTALFQTLFGRFEWNLLLRSGVPILARTHAGYRAGLDRHRDWPIVRTLNGRNDPVVGWRSAVELYDAMARSGRPAVHYFDEREHSPSGYWRGLEPRLLARTFQTRRDRPSLRFGACTLDDDPGSGRPSEGTRVGTINGYVDYDRATARATATAVDFDVFVRREGALDDAPAEVAEATLQPWRTGLFQPQAGEAALFTLRAGAELRRQRLLFADGDGRVTTPAVELAVARQHVEFALGTLETHAPLFLAAPARAGDAEQVVVRGIPRGSYLVALALGDRFGPRTSPFRLERGTLEETGIRELAVPLARALPDGAWLWARARIGAATSPPVGVPLLGSVERDAGHASPH
jgi:S-formylglutathione hydrolase FrmB